MTAQNSKEAEIERLLDDPSYTSGAAIGRKVGVTRQRVQQVAEKMGVYLVAKGRRMWCDHVAKEERQVYALGICKSCYEKHRYVIRKGASSVAG